MAFTPAGPLALPRGIDLGSLVIQVPTTPITTNPGPLLVSAGWRVSRVVRGRSGCFTARPPAGGGGGWLQSLVEHTVASTDLSEPRHKTGRGGISMLWGGRRGGGRQLNTLKLEGFVLLETGGVRAA